MSWLSARKSKVLKGVDVAKSGKSRSKKDETAESAETVDDAVILPPEEETPLTDAAEPEPEIQDDDLGTDLSEEPDEEADAGEDDANTDDIAEDDGPDDTTYDDIEEVADADEDAIEEEFDDAESGETDEYQDDGEGADEETDYSEDDYEAPTQETAPTREVVVQKVGFIPLLLGGAIAAGLGFVLAFFYYGQPGADFEALISAQTDRISELEAQVASLPTEQPDLAPIATRIDDAQSTQTALAEQLGAVSTDVAAQISAFDERLNALERAPAEDGTLAETAIASWERELDALREQFIAQEAEMEALTAQAQADLEAARAEAEEVELSAAEAAQAAIGRAALSRVQAALDSGSAFDAALADLQSAGAEIPPELTAVASEGVPAINDLREEFPTAARSALAAARSEGLADDGANAVTAFFREQLDVRSVVPRDGGDPDAILSRAEAALAEGRLTDALAEIEALPEVARAEMSGWIEQASARAAALAAAESIDQSLSN